MHRVMGQGWSQRRITVTCIKPENTSLSPRTFDVGSDEDLKDEIAAALGITRDVLVTRHNPHNGLRFFYVDLSVVPTDSVQKPRLPPGAVRVFVDPSRYSSPQSGDETSRNGSGPLGQNHLAQGLMRKGDKNHDAPIIRGPCYVCKQCTDRDPFASCFPEDFDVITGRSRVTAAEHLLVLGDLEEQTSQPKKPKQKDASPPPPPMKEKEEEQPKTTGERQAIEISGVLVAKEDVVEEDPVQTAAVECVTVPLVAQKKNEEDLLPAKLAPLRDMVYCQILLSGIKGTTTTPVPKVEEEEPQPPPVEHVSSPPPPPHPPVVVDVVTAVTETTTTTTSPPPETDEAAAVVVVEKPKKPVRRGGRRNDVCADNIVPEGVRRSARLKK